MQYEPILLSTWHFGLPANHAGWKIIENNGSALDAAEAAANHAELDVSVTSVGKGGLPDERGVVTLDAAVMDGEGNAGAVACVRNIAHVASLARSVMEKTSHVMLVGEGAEQFARAQGFPSEDLLTPESLEKFEKHKTNSAIGKEMPNEEPWKRNGNDEDHDTIGVIARDLQGKVAAACTTSGLAWKLHGRVGDSPIIGAGLYVDAAAGAAVATGTGELMMKTCASFLIVELMRSGWEPRPACEEAIRRIRRLNPVPQSQAGFIALRADGMYAAACLREGFEYAIRTNAIDRLIPAEPYIPQLIHSV
jgi:N4-(beta-N-acetylglucosaminyl)-L-asparaginase